MSVEIERAARKTCSMSVAPPTRCSTLACLEFIRVLLPAAKIRTRRLSIIIFDASQLSHFEDRVCQAVRIMANNAVFCEQIAFHDIQLKREQLILVHLHESGSFGVVLFLDGGRGCAIVNKD